MAIITLPFLKHHSARSSAIVFCLSLLEAGACRGVDYTLQANATLRQDYNTNIQMLPASFAQPVWASGIEVKTGVQAAAPAWLASAAARFDNWFYAPGLKSLSENLQDQEELQNLQNQYLDGRYAYQSERSRWELTGGYINDTLLSSQSTELQGIVIRPISRDIKSITPSWTYGLSEYTKLNVSYSYYRSDYPGNIAFYPNSTSQSVLASVNHQASERLSLNALLSATSFVPQSSSFQSQPSINRQIQTKQERTIDYVNLMFGFNYAFNANTDMAFSGGGQYSQTSNTRTTLIGIDNDTIYDKSEQKDELFSPLFDIRLHKKYENIDLTLLYNHQSSPSINSQLFTADRVSLNATHGISQRLNAGLRFSYYGSSIPVQTANPAERRFNHQNFFQMGGDLSYALSKNCLISASYNYKFRELPDNVDRNFSEPQEAHVVSVSLRYEFDKLHY